MAADPSIILGIKPPQFDSPLDTARQAQSLQALGYQNQMQQRAMADDQATRAAYQSAMTAGPGGVPTLDRQKLLASLAQSNPMLAYKNQQELAANDSAQAKSQMEVTKAQREQDAQKLGQIIALPPEQKQAAWDAERAEKISKGYPGAANAPQQYPGDQHLYASMTALMGPKDQVELKEKQQEFAQREADRKLQYAQMGVTKQNQALQQTQSILENARGNAEVTQALKDQYAAKKFESLVNLYGDPNKLDPQQVQLAASEVAKIATGGVPTSHELQGLNQATLPKGLATLAQAAMNRPESAQAGEFVKRLGDYVGALKKDAQGVVFDKFHRVVETRHSSLGEGNYDTLTKQYVDPINQKMFPKAPSIGTVEDGHKYMGGDPADQNSWRATK